MNSFKAVSILSISKVFAFIVSASILLLLISSASKAPVKVVPSSEEL
jgi:hypothetical protein